MSNVEPGWQFASDNTAGICPEAWNALALANVGYAPSYGEDRWTARASELIRALFECPQAQVFFVFNGTAANSLSLAALCRSYHAVICHEQSHVYTDECGAPEFFSGGAKLLPVPGPGAKLSPAAVLRALDRRDDVHASKPRAISISQSTEWGSIYRPEEIAALGAMAREYRLALHMDGARFANALAASRTIPGARAASAADLTWRAGVDVLSLGGTKCGLNTTEAVVLFKPELAVEFDYRGKQGAQLASKMRLQTSQWVGVLESGAWQRHAAHANASARQLAARLERELGLAPLRAVEANAVFVELDPSVADSMAAAGWHFHRMGEAGYRLMCSWATRSEDIERFVGDLARCRGGQS
jgi:threonine aldolase